MSSPSPLNENPLAASLEEDPGLFVGSIDENDSGVGVGGGGVGSAGGGGGGGVASNGPLKIVGREADPFDKEVCPPGCVCFPRLLTVAFRILYGVAACARVTPHTHACTLEMFARV